MEVRFDRLYLKFVDMIDKIFKKFILSNVTNLHRTKNSILNNIPSSF